MADYSKVFVDFVNYRAAKKEQILSYLTQTASQSPAIIQQQWVALRNEQDAASQLDAQIEKLRVSIASGIADRIDSAQRAIGTARTAVIQQQGAIQRANIRARTDLAVEDKRGARAVDEDIARAESEGMRASEGFKSGITQSAQSAATPDVLASSIGTTLRSAIPELGKFSDPISRAAYLAGIQDQISAAVSGRQDIADPAAFGQTIIANVLGAQPNEYSAQSISLLRDSTKQARLGTIKSTGNVDIGGGSGRFASIPEQPSRAQLMNTDEAGLTDLAIRATLSRLQLEAPEQLAKLGATIAEQVASPEFQREVKFMRDSAPLVDLQTYGDPRVVSLMEQSLAAKRNIAERRDALTKSGTSLPTAQELFDKATLAFTDIYGTPASKRIVEGVQRSAADKAAMEEAVLKRTKEVVGLPKSGEDQDAYYKRFQDQYETFFKEATAPIAASLISPSVMRKMNPEDRSVVQQEALDQQKQKDWWYDLAHAPEASTATQVTPETIDAIQRSGTSRTPSNANRPLGPAGQDSPEVYAIPGSRNEAAGRLISGPEPEFDVTPGSYTPTNQPGTRQWDFPSKTEQPETDEPVRPEDIEFIKPNINEVTQTPSEDPNMASPTIKKLVSDDEEVDVPRWYMARPVDQDPIVVIPMLLSGGKKDSDLSDSDKSKLNGALQRLNEDFRRSMGEFERAALGSEEKAEAALHLQDIKRVAEMVEAAQRPDRTARDVEDRRLVAAADKGMEMGAEIAKKPISGNRAIDAAQWVKQTFGRNLLKNTEIVLVKELVRSRSAPRGGAELSTQLARVVGNRWVRPEVREQVRALYLALHDNAQALGGE